MPSSEGVARKRRRPQTLNELQLWVRHHLRLPAGLESELLTSIDEVFTRYERLWQESKQEAVRALSSGFSEQMARLRHELHAKDATTSSIAHYFEHLVADLTERTHRDPKTKLMNFGRFSEELESFLALEQRGRWSAVGLVDITGFKRYNDSLGHAVGDKIIEKVATLLREQVRADDVIAQDAPSSGSLHARFGGDEFCFLVPALAECHQAHAVAERFREAVERYDWTQVDRRLDAQPVKVDVGVVCLWLGHVEERRALAGSLAAALIQRADELMYEAKGQRAGHIHFLRARVDNGELLDVVDVPA